MAIYAKEELKSYIVFHTNLLRDYSRDILENKVEALRLNIERRALKKQLNELSRYPILTFYKLLVEKQLEDNKKLMDLIAQRQKYNKGLHAHQSKCVCDAIRQLRNLEHDKQ